MIMCQMGIFYAEEYIYPLTIFGVMRDDRYFMFRHWLSDNIGTRTCCTIAGRDPPSDVRPQPTAMPVLPAGSNVGSVGTQTGAIVLLNSTGLRSFISAMS